MNGILVVNKFLSTEKFRDIYARLNNAFSEREGTLSLCANSDLIAPLGEAIPFPQNPDFVLFWDKDVSLAKQIEAEGIPVFNSASAIEICDDKTKTHLALSGLPAPKTIIAPKTFPNIGYTDTEFLVYVAEKLGFPIVIKEAFGSFGAQVYLANNMSELISITKEHETAPLIFQELVKESRGVDVRMNVVGHKFRAAMKRESKNGDFRSNVTLGGSGENYMPTEAEIALAEEASRRIGLDFAGIDILFGHNGPLLCEVNSNAHFKSTLDCTGIDLASLIAEHIISKLR